MTGEKTYIRSGLQPDEKTTPVMVYTQDALIWGNVVTKKSLKASRLLIGVSVPDFITIIDAQNMPTVGNQLLKPSKFTSFFLPVSQILGYHLVPPSIEPYDFDESEPNRAMKPVVIQVGAFHFNANLRISTQTTIKDFLGVSKAQFISVYDLEIVHPYNENLKPVKTNMALVRREAVSFGT